MYYEIVRHDSPVVSVDRVHVLGPHGQQVVHVFPLSFLRRFDLRPALLGAHVYEESLRPVCEDDAEYLVSEESISSSQRFLSPLRRLRKSTVKMRCESSRPGVGGTLSSGSNINS